MTFDPATQTVIAHIHCFNCPVITVIITIKHIKSCFLHHNPLPWSCPLLNHRQRGNARASEAVPPSLLPHHCSHLTASAPNPPNSAMHSHIEIHRQRLKCKAVPSWGWGGEVWEPVTLCARQYVAIQCSTVGAMSWGQSIRVSAMIRQQPPTPALTSNNHLFPHHCHPPHPRPKFNTKAA